jgi:hypothetical protein
MLKNLEHGKSCFLRYFLAQKAGVKFRVFRIALEVIQVLFTQLDLCTDFAFLSGRGKRMFWSAVFLRKQPKKMVQEKEFKKDQACIKRKITTFCYKSNNT